jgi:3-oxoacyl-[acyl-carrier protein] reductase
MNILITGGASGLGLAITEALATKKDNYVFFTFCKSVEKAKNLENKHSNVKGIYCDFSSEESINQLISKMAEFQLQALINNALTGITKAHFHKLDANSVAHSFQTNVLPTIKISQRAVDIFRKAKFGKIITILSSAICHNPPIGWSSYVAEKNYLLSICKSISTENSSFNITSNCISPSFMLTELNKDTDERMIDLLKQKHPLKRLLTVSEVAEVVVFYLSASQQLNGVNIVVNAGGE